MKQFPRYSLEDWLLIILVVAVLVFILFALFGCSSRKLTQLDVLCVGPNGEVFHVTGQEAAEAKNFEDKWDFRACDVTVGEIKTSK